MNEKPNTTGDDMGRPAGGSGEKILQEAKSAVGHMAKDAKGEVERRVESQKDRAADTIGTVADAIRAAAEPLADMGPLPELTGRAADEIERVAAYVQSRSVGDLVKEVERYARREPAVFLGAALGLGLLAGRFLKSSPRGAGLHPEIRDEPFARTGEVLDTGYGARGRFDAAGTRREPSYVGARGGWSPQQTTSATPYVGQVDRTMNSGLQGAGTQGTGRGSPYDTAGSSVSAKLSSELHSEDTWSRGEGATTKPMGTMPTDFSTLAQKPAGSLPTTPATPDMSNPTTIPAKSASSSTSPTNTSSPASSRPANGSGDDGSVRRP